MTVTRRFECFMPTSKSKNNHIIAVLGTVEIVLKVGDFSFPPQKKEKKINQSDHKSRRLKLKEFRKASL